MLSLNKNFVTIGISLLLGIFIFSGLAFAGYKFFVESDKQENINELTSAPSENNVEPDYSGFDTSGIVTQPVIPASPPPVTSEPIIIGKELEPVSTTPKISMGNPSVKVLDEKVRYSYPITLNQQALDKYKSGFKYNIDSKSCDLDEDIFETGIEFDGTMSSPKSLSQKVEIEINDEYLASKTALVESEYEIKDLAGKTIFSGKTKVPSCEEPEDFGEFKIEVPEIDKDMNAPDWHFQYRFIFDEKADEILEEGFTHKIDHDCDDWLDENYFESEWDEGGMNSGMGFGVNIDEEAFEDLDDDEVLENSTYEIYDSIGHKIFAGSVKVPNCQ